MNRKQAHAIYHHLYDRTSPVMDGDVCQYCGVDVDLSDDHVPALTTAHLYSNSKDVEFIIVRSCMECNILLSNDLLPMFSDRFFSIKERLLGKYKKDLVNEFRNGLTWSDEHLKEADWNFNRMLDRIGFGLVSFDYLNDESQSILNLVVDAYGETLGTLIANRSGGGLLRYDNVQTEEKSPVVEGCSYSKFLQIIKFQSLEKVHAYEQWLNEHFNDIKDYLLPDNPVAFYGKHWAEIWKEASGLIVDEMPDAMSARDYCSFDEFIEILVERNLTTPHKYKEWYNSNLWGAVMSLDMPEAPEHLYKTTWTLIEQAYDRQCQVREAQELDDGELPSELASKLDTLELILTEKEAFGDLVIRRAGFDKFIYEAELDSLEIYLEFLDAIKDEPLSIHLPSDPVLHYQGSKASLEDVFTQ